MSAQTRGLVAGAVALGLLSAAAAAWAALRSPATAPRGSALTPYPGDPSEGAGGARTPPGQRVVKQQLPPYPGNRCVSLRSLLGLVRQAGLGDRPAVLFLAHVARETGSGRDTWNNNFGNRKEFGSGPWYRHGTQPYSAYATPLEGMRAMLAVLDMQRYARAKALLLAGDRSWYSALGLAGYYEYRRSDGTYVAHTTETIGTGQADYDTILAGVEACL